MGRTQRLRLRVKKERQIAEQRNALAQPSEKPLLPLYKQLLQLGWQNNTHLFVSNFETGGHGICSKTKCYFQAGDALINMPLRCLITYANINADEGFKALFDSSKFTRDISVSLEVIMAMYLLYHKHGQCNEYMQAYLAILPATFATPFFCTLAEMKYLPDSLVQYNWKTLNTIREAIKRIRQCLQQSHCQCCNRPYFDEVFTADEFKWAYFAVNTRSVYINGSELSNLQESFFKNLLSGQPNFALAPFLDLFNHSDTVRTSAEVCCNENGEKQYSLKLLQCAEPITRFKQIFISYGQLNNFRLLTQYGFIIRHNKHNYIEFDQEDVQAFTRKKRNSMQQDVHRSKFVFLREHNFFDNMFLNESDGASHNLLVVLHILFKAPSHYANMLNQVAFGDAEQFDDVSAELNELINYKIEQYETAKKLFDRMDGLSISAGMVCDFMADAIDYLRAYQLRSQT